MDERDEGPTFLDRARDIADMSVYAAAIALLFGLVSWDFQAGLFVFGVVMALLILTNW